MSTKRRPVRMAATAVVPEPPKVSSITPPGGHDSVINFAIRFTGFCVG